jgi:hypothetical protein
VKERCPAKKDTKKQMLKKETVCKRIGKEEKKIGKFSGKF